MPGAQRTREGQGPGTRSPQGLYKNLNSLCPLRAGPQRWEKRAQWPRPAHLLSPPQRGSACHACSFQSTWSSRFSARLQGPQLWCAQSPWVCVSVCSRWTALLCLSLGRLPAAPAPAPLLGPSLGTSAPSPWTLSVEPTCPRCLHLPAKLAPSSRHLSYLSFHFMLLIFFLKMTVNGRIS